MEWTWLILLVIFLIVEGLTFNLVTIWFAIGSLGAFITAYFTTDTTTQLLVFVIVSVILLFFTRPIIKKYILIKPEKTNLDAVIGQTGVVIKKITTTELGRVKAHGKDWAATSNKIIKEGSLVEILEIKGVKLVVKEKEKK
jgi:membrane protein implicated in regulation of membrane protease activity